MSILQMPSQTPTDFAAVVGRTIQQRREALGLSLFVMAERCGFHPSILKLMEQGVWIPNYEEVCVLAEVMGCDLVALAFFADLAEIEVQPRFNQRRKL